MIDAIEKYTNGYCDCLAIAIHRKVKLPINILYSQVSPAELPSLVHAYIKVDQAKGLDIKGLRSISSIREEYKSYTRRKPIMVSEQRLMLMSTLNEQWIKDAEAYASNLIGLLKV